MISGFLVTKLWIASQVTAWGPVDSSGSAMPKALWTADWALAIVGSAVAVGALVAWLARSCRDPLATTSLRDNWLREDSLILAMFVYLTAYLIASGLIELAAGGGAGELTGGVAGSVAQVAGIAICLWIAAKKFDGGVRRFCLGEAGAVGRKLMLTVLMTAVALGLCPVILEVTGLLIRYVSPEHEFAPHSVVEALRDDTQPIAVTIGLWLGAIVIAPAAEELFFRGILQTYLVGVFRRWLPTGVSCQPIGGCRRPGGGCRWIAIGVASVAFGVAHFPQPHAIPALMFLAVLFGYAYERTGSLWPPIVMHAVFNLKTLTWEALGAFPA